MNTPTTMEAKRDTEPVFFFDHPYPRYGLAVTLVEQRKATAWREALEDEEQLMRMASSVVEAALGRFRVHTQDDLDEDRTLRYRYLSNDELEPGGQKADDGYLIAPHVMTIDRQGHNSVNKARSYLSALKAGVEPSNSADLKRSLTPFSKKLNEGGESLSDPKSSQLEAVFSLVATLTPRKPAAQVNFTNQAIILDLDLEGMIRFVQLFRDMQDTEQEDPLTLKRPEDSNRKRPPLFDGNYPDAPRSAAFGPVGLMGALGQWAKRADILAETQEKVAETLKQMAGRPVYLVSYDSSLMRQEYVGHHAARLAQEYNLPKVIDSLYRARFYKDADNKPDSPARKNFFRMAGRFLQLYTKPAFRDFLAFRVQYDSIFFPIITDFVMSEYQIDRDIVQSARTYGSYLNTVAYFIAKEEVEENKKQEGGGTGRDIYEAKARALAQLESTALSARRPSALFAQLNVMAGRQANRDVPAEAERFIEAVNTGEVEFDEAKDLVLAYMRLRANGDANTPSNGSSRAASKETDDAGYYMDDD
jgi:hypothetical protein